MAKFAPYYALCPLIDCRSLLGISEDVEDGNVIVTLGKNIAINYKLSNQKQLLSWRTKEKFTSPVIYDKDINKYVAVFNHTVIRLWTGEEDEQLDKIKKFKFHKQIFTLVHLNDTTFVIFKNGQIYPLQQALDERKSLDIQDVLSENENIEQILNITSNDTLYIGFIVRSTDKCHFYWTTIEKQSVNNEFKKISLSREGDCKLTGSVLHKTPNVSLLSSWSDNKVFSTDLDQTHIKDTIGDLFTILEQISSKQEISMSSLNDNYLAIHGASANEEGALLVIYNTQFKVNQTKQPFKLYTKGTQLWRIDNNLFLPVGQNLAVIPFCLETEQLAALVGSHKSVEQDPDVAILEDLEIGNWENSGIPENNDMIPEVIQKKIAQIGKRGLTESVLMESLLLDILETNNLGLLKTCLDYFCDISEKCLSKILSLLLNLDAHVFENKLNESENFPKGMQPAERADLINIILSKPYSDVLLFSHLRNDLNVDQVVLLLEYIYFLYTNEQNSLPLNDFVKNDAKLISWCTILIDSNYQKFLLVKDQKIIDLLIRLNQVIEQDLNAFKDFNQTESVLTHFIEERSFSLCSNHYKYSVEQLNWY